VPRSTVVLAAAFLVGCAADIGPGMGDPDGGGSSGGADAGEVPSPDAGPPGDPLGSFQLTYYWITDEADYTGVPDTDVFDPSCNVLATVTSNFFDSLRLEGTGRLIDDRVINYWGACACSNSPCFEEVDAGHPWGSGSMSRALVPFRSIAVDTGVLTIGHTYYAPALDGVAVPGDSPWGDFAHDGCLVADDTGGGINGMHVDFFVALRDAYVTLDGDLALDQIDLYDGGARCPDN